MYPTIGTFSTLEELRKEEQQIKKLLTSHQK